MPCHANRGEIAIRAFRAAYELGASAVAVFPYEDRTSGHRFKADEAHQIGEQCHPVRAYLSIEEIVNTARRSGGGRHLSRVRISNVESGAGGGLRGRKNRQVSATITELPGQVR